MSGEGFAAFCVVVAVVLLIGGCVGCHVNQESLIRLRTEAVERGVARYTIDPTKGGWATFEWIDKPLEAEGTTP